MKKTIRKIFFEWDFDKEEAWLNEMSAKGLQLSGVGFCKYIFDEGKEGEYIYRLEMLEKRLKHPKSAEYIRHVEASDAEKVGSIFGWVYFRKKAGAEFDLFPDVDSHIAHIQRVLWLIGIVAGINLMNAVNQIHFLFSSKELFHFVICFLCLAVGVFCGYGFISLYLKKRKLEKVKKLHK